MKRSRLRCFRVCAWAQVFLLLVSSLPLSPILAATTDDLTFSDLTKLSSLETVIYGSSYKNMPSDKRIGSLERVVFGKVQKGTLPDRLKAIVSTVNGQHTSLLAPPIAPELDRSDPVTKTASPTIAPQAAVQSSSFADDMPPTAEGDRAKAMLVQAMQLYSQGQTDRAETMFKNVLALDSHNSDANFNLGAIAESRSDWQNALHYYQAALSARPDDKDTQLAVQSMQAKIKSGQLSNPSPQPSQQAAAVPPSKLSGQQMEVLRQKVNQAASYYQAGNYDAAVNILRDVANQAPGQADVQYALGQAYKAEGQNAYARSALAQAVSLAPNNPDYRNALQDLDQQMAAGANNRSADTFGNNNYGNTTANQNNGPIGQLTPFSGDNGTLDNQSGWQSTAPATRFYSGSSFGPGYMPGYVSGGYSPYGMGGYGFGGGMGGTAAMAGLAGLALGSMFGLMMSHHHRY